MAPCPARSPSACPRGSRASKNEWISGNVSWTAGRIHPALFPWSSTPSSPVLQPAATVAWPYRSPGIACSSRQTIRIGRSPSADSSVTFPRNV